jgi:hypothetical protein
MGDWNLTRAQAPEALTEAVQREMRKGKAGGPDCVPPDGESTSIAAWCADAVEHSLGCRAGPDVPAR